MKKQIQVHAKVGPSKLAFTLVELIVVITILAILGTIAFISLQGYSRSTRNSVRISDLSNINKMIGVKIASTGKVPAPVDYVEITASGTTLTYQGIAGEKVLDILGVFNGGKDPLDETYYTYSTNTNLTKYELIGFLEGDVLSSNLNMLESTNAETDLSLRTVETRGDELGIILDVVTNVPVTETVDVLNTIETYKTVFTKTDEVEGTGGVLFSNIYNRNEDLLKNKNLAKLDESLVGYWDMETMSGSFLDDISGNGNYGTLRGGVSVGDVNGLLGKATSFDGIDDWIKIMSDGNLSLTGTLTVSAFVKLYSNDTYGGIAFVGESYSYGLWLQNRRVRGGTWDINSTQNSLYSDFFRTNEKWYHLVLTYDKQNINFFIDSILYKTYSSNLDIREQNSWMAIGGKIPNEWYTEGIIDEVRIYNRALSDEEIETLYNVTK